MSGAGGVDDETLTAEERRRLQSLLAQPLVAEVFAALGAEHARIVGGAVRNALLGEPVRDIDFATTWPPEEVMRRLSRAGFSMHPVGLDHGSVLAAKDGRTFEITTLRRDVKTDGRHAVVAYTDDWAEDARRRDFTMNALYLDAEGRLHDPVGGLADARARRLRFIGDAAWRMREDYLRILRYFRFLAQYAADAPEDLKTLAVIARERAGLQRISKERIRAEMQKLLTAPGAAHALELMLRTGVADAVFPPDCTQDMVALERMMAQDAALALEPDWLLRLLAFCGVRDSLKAAFKLTRAEMQRLVLLRRMLVESGALPGDEHGWQALAYRAGMEGVRDVARLAAARGQVSEDALQGVIDLLRRWQPPAFALRGRDVLALGIAPGAAVGELLRRVEERWIAQGFRPQDRAGLLALLKQEARALGSAKKQHQQQKKNGKEGKQA